jgi:hypothetical protein
MSAIKDFAWVLSIIAATVGTTLVAAGMTEELRAIAQSTLRRNFKR